MPSHRASRVDRLPLVGLLVAGLLLAGASRDVGASPHLRKPPPHPPAGAPSPVPLDTLHVGSLTLHRCGGAYCGSVLRALDPTGHVPGTIRVRFEWYPHSDTAHPPLEPIVAAEGGPGYATTGSRDGYLGLFAPLRDRHDMLLVDARGTGTSQPLDCPGLQTIASSFQTVHGCGAQLGDTRYLYGSGLAADDMAAILDALGVATVDLYGDSYGTFFSQAFAGRHPERLRSVVLDSAYPVRGLSPWYPEIAITARYAFDAACMRSPACNALPGNSMQRIDRLVQELRAHPFTGQAPDGNGVMQDVHATATNLGYLMVGNATQGVVYRDLDAAARAHLDQGDPLPLLRLLAENGLTDTSGGVPDDPADFSEATFVAVSCQDYPQIYSMTSPLSARRQQRNRAIAQEQRDHPDVYAPFTIGEFAAIPLDTSVLDLCLGWDPPSVPPPYPPGVPVPPAAAFTSAPVLVLSGDLDSLTPALQGAQAAALFPNARHVVFDNSFHVTATGDEDDCASGIVQRFVRTLDPGSVACAHAIAEVHLVPAFAKRARDVAPASAAAGNQGTDADLRVVAAAAQTVGDVIARWWVNWTGDGTGLRGGTYDYSTPSSVTHFNLHDVRWVGDLKVSGTASWDYDYPGSVVAHLHVAGGATEEGDLTLRWDSRIPLAHAAINGRIGGRRIVATLYAP